VTRLIRAEWMKLTTTRLLWALLPAAVVLSVAAVTGAVLSADGAGVDLATDDGLRRALHVSATGAILVLVLGIVMSAGEYRTQTATDTFLTTPRRARVLAAKLVVGATIGVGFGAVAATGAFVASHVLYNVEDVTFPTGDSLVWLTLAGSVVYAGLYGALGVAIGALARNQIAAIVAALAWLLVIEQVVISITSSIGRWLPGGAGQAIVNSPESGLLDQVPAIAVLSMYAVAIAAGALVITRRRDA
jgi:ABC-2 type transport system permease protein